jgi:hypothetical protein
MTPTALDDNSQTSPMPTCRRAYVDVRAPTGALAILAGKGRQEGFDQAARVSPVPALPVRAISIEEARDLNGLRYGLTAHVL